MSETDGETIDPKAPPPQLTLKIEPAIVDGTGGKHDALVLREPTVGQKRTASEQLRNGTNAATVNLYEIHLIAAVSGKPVGVVERLPVSTLNRAMAYVDYFLDDGRRTGWS